MKRSGISCGKGFKPRSSRLKATGALQRNAEISRKAAKPKPPKRDPAEARARALLKARSNSICEMCGRNPATDAHHRINRSQGGRWDIANLLHLCHAHHMQVTVNPALACERGWSVRSHQDPAEMPAWVAGRGWTRLTADGGYESTERGAA